MIFIENNVRVFSFMIIQMTGCFYLCSTISTSNAKSQAKSRPSIKAYGKASEMVAACHKSNRFDMKRLRKHNFVFNSFLGYFEYCNFRGNQMELVFLRARNIIRIRSIQNIIVINFPTLSWRFFLFFLNILAIPSVE